MELGEGLRRGRRKKRINRFYMECPGLRCQFRIEVVVEVNNSMKNEESGLKAEGKTQH